ncbi:MAG: flippase-like domain-containing protein [Thermoanaerobaculia bacterium]|nr:flippase-like domain-containing protein [Thermoanaerobaculia bacterium]
MIPGRREALLPSLASGWRLGLLAGLLAIALLAWAAGRVDLHAVADVLRGVEPGWVLLAALVQVAALAWRGVRWHALLAGRVDVPLAAALRATFMGWVALALLPARLGELARPWLLARRHAIDRSFAFGAQQLERLLDVVCVLALLALYLGAAPASADSAESRRLLAALSSAEGSLAIAVAAIVAVLAAAVGLAPRLEEALRRLASTGAAAGRAGWIVDRARAFAHGLTAIRSPRALLAAVFHSVALWGLVCLSHWCLFRAFDLELPRLAVAPLLAFIVLGTLLPTPVAIGSYHAAVQLALASLLGLSLATASGYAVVGHAVAYLPNLALGSTLLLLDGGTEAGATRGR